MDCKKSLFLILIMFFWSFTAISYTFIESSNAQEKTWDFGSHSDPPYPSKLSSNGARHIDTNRAWLGTNVSKETGSNQILNDTHTDGLVSMNPITVEVTNNNWTGNLYLNVLVDKFNDGKWTPFNHTIGEFARLKNSTLNDWVVQNKKIDIPKNTTETIETDSTIKNTVIGTFTDTSIRITLTGKKIDYNYTGKGEFQIGETEDYQKTTSTRWTVVQCSAETAHHSDVFVTFDVSLLTTDGNAKLTNIGKGLKLKNVAAQGTPESIGIENVNNAIFLTKAGRWQRHPIFGFTNQNIKIKAEGDKTSDTDTCSVQISHINLFNGLGLKNQVVRQMVGIPNQLQQMVNGIDRQEINKQMVEENKDIVRTIVAGKENASKNEKEALKKEVKKLENRIDQMKFDIWSLLDITKSMEENITNVIDAKFELENKLFETQLKIDTLKNQLNDPEKEIDESLLEEVKNEIKSILERERDIHKPQKEQLKDLNATETQVMSDLEDDLNQINSFISDLESNNQEITIQVADIINSTILEPRRQSALDTLNKFEKKMENTTTEDKQKLQNLLNTVNNTEKELKNIKNDIENLDTINADDNTTIVNQYDQNNDGNIGRGELRTAIIDLVNDELSRNELRQVIIRYVEDSI